MARSFALLVTSMCGLTFGGVWFATAPAVATSKPAAQTVRYPGCDAVRAAGKAPLRRGEPGYRVEMDGDGDGVACEPHRSDYRSDGSGRTGLFTSRGRRRGR